MRAQMDKKKRQIEMKEEFNKSQKRQKISSTENVASAQDQRMNQFETITQKLLQQHRAIFFQSEAMSESIVEIKEKLASTQEVKHPPKHDTSDSEESDQKYLSDGMENNRLETLSTLS